MACGSCQSARVALISELWSKISSVRRSRDKTSAEYPKLKAYLQTVRNVDPDTKVMYTIEPRQVPAEKQAAPYGVQMNPDGLEAFGNAQDRLIDNK